MNYIFESIIVGIYSVILFIIISYFIKNKYFILFIVGFIKHLLGGYLNIHNFYCNYGYSCYLHNDCKNGKCYDDKKYLFLRSLFEGLLYLFVGSILIELPFDLKNIYLYFLIGFILHLFFEWLGIHKYFYKTYCKKEE
jgi:hypothetical protein